MVIAYVFKHMFLIACCCAAGVRFIMFQAMFSLEEVSP